MTTPLIRVDYQKVIKRSQEFFKRAQIAVTPPIDIEKAARNLGVHIMRKQLDGDVSGFLFMDKSREPILGVNAKHINSRQRFTIAHELGHLLLHAPKEGTMSFIDKNFFIMHRDLRSAKGVAVEEIEANFFAAEVLMPSELLYTSVAATSTTDETTEWYKSLARKFNVSDEAMRFRLNNLGFIRF